MLLLDIGNTQIKMGVYENDQELASWRMTTSVSKTTDEYGIDFLMLLYSEKIPVESLDAAVVSSVVPAIMHHMISAIRRYLHKEPIIIGPGIKTGVNLKVPNPLEVGADLIADLAAAIELYKGPCIIVDFGTATKYLVVNDKQEFVAAVFSPGIGISAATLTEKAAQLPGFEIKKPRSILANSTVECMQAGIVYGYIGQVKYIVDEIKKETGLSDIKVIATGGFGKIMVPELDCVDVYDKALTLKGIRIIAEKNLAEQEKARQKKALREKTN
ncbi:MAG: type III pantothenate kinase [Lachnospiraceae bacterium]|nr:type III pantothenate kinase [Lachnospiraceae bacterium]